MKKYMSDHLLKKNEGSRTSPVSLKQAVHALFSSEAHVLVPEGN